MFRVLTNCTLRNLGGQRLRIAQVPCDKFLFQHGGSSQLKSSRNVPYLLETIAVFPLLRSQSRASEKIAKSYIGFRLLVVREDLPILVLLEYCATKRQVAHRSGRNDNACSLTKHH